ncbi:hypothetical protein [Sporomusa aerivorans]|uniref:hypothetical protein n=1 Tax=Sporomusa aerivorans TaxID=204936 RepID=UPI00352AE842
MTKLTPEQMYSASLVSSTDITFRFGKLRMPMKSVLSGGNFRMIIREPITNPLFLAFMKERRLNIGDEVRGCEYLVWVNNLPKETWFEIVKGDKND